MIYEILSAVEVIALAVVLAVRLEVFINDLD
nr:MAG TPA: hypothetical protein [Bacteriophage sp.]